MNSLLFDVQIGDNEKNFKLKDLFWLLPLCSIAFSFGSFIILFYYFNPDQLIWAIILIPFYLLILFL